MQGRALLRWLSALPPHDRDAAVERLLGIAAAAPSPSPGEHLVGYHASGVAPIVRMLLEVPVLADDVLVDIGSGAGKVAVLTHLLTGARARGIELQPALVERARAAAARSAVDVSFTLGDARTADLEDGTVFFLYLPFTGRVLAAVLARLKDLALRRGGAIVVCTLGFDVERTAPWLVRRPTDAFWLAIYDSALPGARPRPPHGPSPLAGSDADAIALERERKSEGPEGCERGLDAEAPER